jgi:hypothetical protein
VAQIINNNNNNKDKVTLVSTITFKNVPVVKENTIINEEVTRYISPQSYSKSKKKKPKALVLFIKTKLKKSFIKSNSKTSLSSLSNNVVIEELVKNKVVIEKSINKNNVVVEELIINKGKGVSDF